MDIGKTVRHFKRYNFRYFQHKAYDLTLRRWVASQIDCHRLERQYPGMRHRYHLSKEAIRQKILPQYHEYISEVSSEIMASSLELSIFLLFLCDMVQAEKDSRSRLRLQLLPVQAPCAGSSGKTRDLLRG